MMRNLFFLFTISFILYSCGGDNGGSGTGGENGSSSKCIDGFNQNTLLIKVRDEIIIPNYLKHQTALEELEKAIGMLIENPKEENITSSRNAFKKAYKEFQIIAQYNFGPAAEIDYRRSVNNFPIDTAAVDNNILNLNHDFSKENTFDKGYPALDYLLFSYNNASLITKLKNKNFKKYLSDILKDIKEKTNSVATLWSGDYGKTFITNTGTAAGTSLSQLVNAWNENYEISKRDRIGIPSGILSIGITNPKNVEAYYSQITNELLLESINASENLYIEALSDILQYTKTVKGETTLDKTIKNQFSTIKSDLNKLETTLSKAVNNETQTVKSLYNNASDMVVLTKTDLPTAMCIAITYTENPSDSD